MAVHVTASEEVKAEINVTPLVDVVLVLLILFMVVTPLLKQELPIELPIADTSQPAADVSQVTISLAADGRALVNGVEAPAGELAARLTALYANRADKTIYLEADRALPHGRVVDLMDDVRAAGVVRIGVVTKREPVPPGPLAAASAPSEAPAAHAIP